MIEPIEIPCLGLDAGLTPVLSTHDGKPCVCLDARKGGKNEPYPLSPVAAIQLGQALQRAAEEAE